ncbi:hypothetical protein [Granulicella paludicola]|jgi:hypothetical protein|uniref:hypothetical protein n=1 Tax=Granulicella paludicola TaxID=474951 RepID=UPI0021E054BB|nr:hypothetical protein [Granulicella paludicola]
MSTRLPAAETISRLLCGTLNRAIDLKPAKPFDLSAKGKRVYSVYRDADEIQTCLLICDFPLLVYVAGALLSFPACAMLDSIKAGAMEDSLADSAKEVLNICAQLFRGLGHQVFQRLVMPPPVVPVDIDQTIKTPTERVDFAVDIAGYGTGQLTLLYGPGRNS